MSEKEKLIRRLDALVGIANDCARELSTDHGVSVTYEIDSRHPFYLGGNSGMPIGEEYHDLSFSAKTKT